MPFKTKEAQTEYNKRYYTDQRKSILDRLKKRRAADPEKFREQKRDSYHRNKDEINERRKEKYEERKRQAVEYLGGRCQRCGLEDDCVNVYDFHHIDPAKKDFDISGGKIRSFFESIKKELDKCELLCSNCHRKEHGCCKRQI